MMESFSKTYRFPFITVGHKYEFGNTTDMWVSCFGNTQLPYDRTEEIKEKLFRMFSIACEDDITITMQPEIIAYSDSDSIDTLCYNKYICIFNNDEARIEFEKWCDWLVPVTGDEDWAQIYTDLLDNYYCGSVSNGHKLKEIR